jgi:hypothetical protein
VSEPSYSFEIGEDAEVIALLQHLQRAVLEHPVAAQAAFSALVAEGRAFSRTEEGKRWCRRLAASRLVEKGRAIWDVATLNVLEESESTVVPSRILDAFVKLTHERALETILARLYEKEAPEGGDVSTP